MSARGGPTFKKFVPPSRVPKQDPPVRPTPTRPVLDGESGDERWSRKGPKKNKDAVVYNTRPLHSAVPRSLARPQVTENDDDGEGEGETPESMLDDDDQEQPSRRSKKGPKPPERFTGYNRDPLFSKDDGPRRSSRKVAKPSYTHEDHDDDEVVVGGHDDDDGTDEESVKSRSTRTPAAARKAKPLPTPATVQTGEVHLEYGGKNRAGKKAATTAVVADEEHESEQAGPQSDDDGSDFELSSMVEVDDISICNTEDELDQLVTDNEGLVVDEVLSAESDSAPASSDSELGLSDDGNRRTTRSKTKSKPKRKAKKGKGGKPGSSKRRKGPHFRSGPVPWTLDMYKYVDFGRTLTAEQRAELVWDPVDVARGKQRLDQVMSVRCGQAHTTLSDGSKQMAMSTAITLNKLGEQRWRSFGRKHISDFGWAILGVDVLSRAALAAGPAPTNAELNSKGVYLSCTEPSDGTPEGGYAGSGTAESWDGGKAPGVGRRFNTYDAFQGRANANNGVVDVDEVRKSRHLKAALPIGVKWSIRLVASFPVNTPRAMVQLMEGAISDVHQTVTSYVSDRAHKVQTQDFLDAHRATVDEDRREVPYEQLNGCSPMAQGLHRGGTALREVLWEEVDGLCAACDKPLPEAALAKGKWLMSHSRFKGKPVHMNCYDHWRNWMKQAGNPDSAESWGRFKIARANKQKYLLLNPHKQLAGLKNSTVAKDAFMRAHDSTCNVCDRQYTGATNAEDFRPVPEDLAEFGLDEPFYCTRCHAAVERADDREEWVHCMKALPGLQQDGLAVAMMGHAKISGELFQPTYEFVQKCREISANGQICPCGCGKFLELRRAVSIADTPLGQATGHDWMFYGCFNRWLINTGQKPVKGNRLQDDPLPVTLASAKQWLANRQPYRPRT
ncbi:unnamed protein product [Zymoseptoria tritici ST99CH_3D7]|uniref:Uncharacterized protein n=1 Tax=Zymoseptoria tritici (strain ST99CH_3D7) TaxID=1276538 RepID=A0A1X7RDK5_ZYMT9|nr:unnamed protein product [Zymoseptoria tritici ST99CH_3D7]